MEIVLRSIIMFILLFILVKLLGKKQINKLTLYDYILSITIGSIAADSILSLDVPIYDGIIALVVFGVIGYIVSIISYHCHKVEGVMDGEPLTLFENNDFNYDNLELAKLSVTKVLEQCRLKGCFDINKLDCAILEPSGEISILLKEKAQPVTGNDLKSEIQKKSQKHKPYHLIIVDGVINEIELEKVKKNKLWLKQYIKDKNLKLENISLFIIDEYNKITVFNKN